MRRPRAADLVGAVTSTQIAAGAVGATQIAAGAVTETKLAADAVSSGQLKSFVSGQVVGTGAAQNIAHGLAEIPAEVLFTIEEGHNGAGAAGIQVPVITQGAHTSTNLVVTVSTAAKVRAIAFAP